MINSRFQSLSISRRWSALVVMFCLGLMALSGARPAQAQTTSGTNFGSVNLGSTSNTMLVPVTITANGSLGSLSVMTKGATGKDFKEAPSGTTCTTTTTYSSGDTCSVAVQFSPLHPGLRMGAVQLYDGSGAVLGTAMIQGVGVGPQAIFPSNSDAITLPPGGLVGFNRLAVDGYGDVFVLNNSSTDDTVKEIVAVNGKVSSTSQVRDVGNGFKTMYGLAVDGAGDVFVAEDANSGTGSIAAVFEIVAVNGQVSSTSQVEQVGSGFGIPHGLAVDGYGDVFVADMGKNAVFEIVANHGPVDTNSTINTVVSGSSFGIGSVNDVAVDASGDIYVLDTVYTNPKGGYGAVYEIPTGCTTSACVKTLGSGFYYPYGVAVDAAGDVFVADSNNNAVKEIVAASGKVETLSSAGEFNHPVGVAVDASGNVFVADTYHNVAKEMPLATAPSHIFPTATAVGTIDTTDGPFPVTIANDGNGTLTFPVPGTGLNPSISSNFICDSSYSGNPCSQITTGGTAPPLDPSASFTLPIEFAPTVPGNISGTAVFTDDSGNATSPYATQTIQLSGVTPGAVTQFAITGANTETAGTSFSITITAEASDGSTATSFNGSATLSSSDPSFVSPGTVTFSNGTATATITLETAGSDSVTATDTADSSITGTTNITVTASAPATISASGGASQTGYVNVAFGTPLQAEVADTYGNPVSNVQVDFTAPASGASATLSPTSCTTGSNGACAVTATANGTTGSYTVTAQVHGDSSAGTASYSLTNQATPTFVVNTTTDDATGLAMNCPSGGSNAKSCTLRDALAAASADGSGIITFDSTVFGSGATITLANGTLNVPSLTTIQGPTSGSGATLTNLVSVDGNKTYRIFYVGSGETGVTIAHLNIADANTGNIQGDQNGGGIDNWGQLTVTGDNFSGNHAGSGGGIANYAMLTVTDSTFTGNSVAGFGGGIATLNGGNTAHISNSTFSGNTTGYKGGGAFNGGDTMMITNCKFQNNTSSGDAGGVMNYGDLTVTGGSFKGNKANGGSGGGIFSYGTTKVSGGTFSVNTTTGNGGGISNSGTLTVSNETFSGNKANSGSGGAIVDENNGNVTLSVSTFSGNSAINGGGIANNGSGSNFNTLTVTDSTFTGNSASNWGGGIINLNNSNIITITNSTFSGNSAGGWGGAFFNGSDTLTLVNSIVSGNTGGPGGIQNFGTLTENHNVFFNNGTDISSGSVDGTDQTADPMLLALGSYGGPLETMLPQPGSSAICAGSASLATSAGLTTGQRGVAMGAGKYCPSGSIDAGAVQTDYSISFSTQPPTSVIVNTPFTAAVKLDENGTPFTASATTIPLTLNATSGSLTGGSAATNTSNGVATYSGLSVDAPGEGDTLTATLPLNSHVTPPLEATQMSQSFNVTAATQTVLTSSPNPSVYGQSVTLTATVTNTSAGTTGTPTGTVTFYEGSTSLGTATLNGSGVATLSTTALTSGSDSLTAIYEGSSQFAKSTSNSVTQTVSGTVSDYFNMMEAQVQQLGLNKGQTSSLLKELNQAAKLYSKGKISGAINNLEDFIAEINDLASSGVISSQEASLLIGEADSLIQYLRS